MSEVIVVIGAGSIGQAIARRVSAGKQIVLADLHQSNADTAAEVIRDACFEVSTATVDVSSRESVHALVETATTLGDITGPSTPPASRPAKHRPRPSSPSTCTEQPSSSKSSATSSHAAAREWSSRRSPGTDSAPSAKSRMQRSPPPPPTSC